ncbi:hypothetical protein WME99_30000 [Sorangium sp. So ce136]|uniref:hypothetical protein n=1 Tax=Sorangium sp. So ce136 TaxID=3133284 RepID=UPI003F0AF8BE
MIHHALRLPGLSALFLAALMSLASMPGCAVSSEEDPCEAGERGSCGAGEGAYDCDEEEGADEAPSEEDAPGPQAPVSAPQAMCSPICDRI